MVKLTKVYRLRGALTCGETYHLTSYLTTTTLVGRMELASTMWTSTTLSTSFHWWLSRLQFSILLVRGWRNRFIHALSFWLVWRSLFQPSTWLLWSTRSLSSYLPLQSTCVALASATSLLWSAAGNGFLIRKALSLELYWARLDSALCSSHLLPLQLWILRMSIRLPIQKVSWFTMKTLQLK